jgi:hypothetical protein
MSEERLTGLALLNVHRDVTVSAERVIDRFAKSKKRCLNFVLWSASAIAYFCELSTVKL